MKKFLAVLLASILLLSLSSVALADNHSVCRGKLIGEWIIYTPDNSLSTDSNYLSITADKAVRTGRDVLLFPIDDNSCYMVDWYGSGSDKPAWHMFTVRIGADDNTLFMIRPTTDAATVYVRK